MKRIMGMIALVLLSVTMLFAHGDEKHVMGTVTKLTDSSITVKDTHGKSVDVAITPTTKFLKNDKPVAAKDIQVGDRIVIQAKQHGNALEATMVKVGAMNMNGMKGMDMHGDMKSTNKSPK
jgi:hypothetical protein